MEKRVWKGLNGLLTEKRVAVACCVLLGLTLLCILLGLCLLCKLLRL